MNPLAWGAKTSLQQSNSAVFQVWVSTRRPMRRRRPQPGVIAHLLASAWNVTKAGCQEVPWHPRQIPACSGEGAETEFSDLLQQNRAWLTIFSTLNKGCIHEPLNWRCLQNVHPL